MHRTEKENKRGQTERQEYKTRHSETARRQEASSHKGTLHPRFRHAVDRTCAATYGGRRGGV